MTNMKISQHLPHFDESNLLISAGKQEACFYLADQDEVRQIEELKLQKPQYTDRESRTERRGDGKMVGGGSSFQRQDDELVRVFIKELTEKTIRLIAEYDIKSIYLFCPTYLSKKMEDNLPKESRNLIEYIFYGNYHHQHPFVLLAKIGEYLRTEQAEMVEPMTGEALKILKETDNPLNEIKNRVY